MLYDKVVLHQLGGPPVESSYGTPPKIILRAKNLHKRTTLSVKLKLLAPQVLTEVVYGPVDSKTLSINLCICLS